MAKQGLRSTHITDKETQARSHLPSQEERRDVQNCSGCVWDKGSAGDAQSKVRRTTCGMLTVSQFFWVGQIKRRDCYKLIYGKIGLSGVPTKEKGPNGPKEIRSFFLNIFLFLNFELYVQFHIGWYSHPSKK